METVKIILIILAVAVVGSGLILAVVALVRSQVREVAEDELDSLEEYEEALYNRPAEKLKEENRNIKRGAPTIK